MLPITTNTINNHKYNNNIHNNILHCHPSHHLPCDPLSQAGASFSVQQQELCPSWLQKPQHLQPAHKMFRTLERIRQGGGIKNWLI